MRYTDKDGNRVLQTTEPTFEGSLGVPAEDVGEGALDPGDEDYLASVEAEETVGDQRTIEDHSNDL